MPYKLLKQIVSFLRKQVKCPNCKSGYDENGIFVIASSPPSGNKVSNGIFLVACPKCASQSFVLIEASQAHEKDVINMQTAKISQRISVNEVLDMHNFLKDWSGDLKELFK